MPMLLETDKTVKITINSTDRSAFYRTGTIHIHTTQGAEVDTCQFELEDKDGTLPAFTGWLPVLVEDETGADLFGGVIVNAVPRHQPGGDRLIWAISCIDYSALMQTKIVDKVYVGETAADILDDLFTTYLSEINATTHVSTGGTRTMRFDRVTLFDAVKMLADVDGYLWWVDASKNLHYIAAGSAAAAPFNVGDAESSDHATIYPYIADSLSVDYDDREIRNRVIVHGGTYASGQTTDLFSGDDTTDVFTVTNRPLRSIIAVLVGSTAQAVGRDWIDNPANFDVLVNYNYGTLTFATPPPTGTNNITVIYTYDINIRVTRNDAASQAAYGRIFEFVHIDRSIGSQAQAEALADAILNAYASRRTYGSFSVQMPGLSPGQEIEITDTALGWTAEAFIIQSVTLTEPVVGVFELRVAFGDREPGFTDIARGFGGGAGGASVGGAGTGGSGGGSGAAYDVPTAPGGLEHVSQNLGIIYVGRAEFLEIGTHFNDWDDYDTASGVVVGYDYINDTGKILLLESGVEQVGLDNSGVRWAAGNGWADADGIGFEIGNNSVNGLTWYDSATGFLRVYADNNTAFATTNALTVLGLDNDDVSVNVLSGSGNTTPAEYVLLGQNGTPVTIHGLLLASKAIGGFFLINADGGVSNEYLSFGISTAGTIEQQLIIDGTYGNFLIGTGWETVPGSTVRATVQTSVQADTILWLTQGNAAHTGDYLLASDTNGNRFALAGSGVFTSTVLDALTNTHAVHTWGHNTTGTAAAGFALRHLYRLESSTTGDQDAAAFDVLWTTATHASRTAAIRWSLVNNAGALAEFMKLTPTELELQGNLKVQGKPLFDPGATLTIASGAITVTAGFHFVDTQDGDASDDLDTINGGVDGAVLVLRANTSARTVVCKDGTGNMQLAGDMSLDNTQDSITLMFYSSGWFEISRSDNGA